LEQNGNNISVFFSSAHNDGQGAPPEADGTGKVTSKGTVEFKWQDSLKNAGRGTISRSGNDMILSLKTTPLADPRCAEFYRENIRLRPLEKSSHYHYAAERALFRAARPQFGHDLGFATGG
jgi:hypothetical protein